jgi:hypothetical protein
VPLEYVQKLAARVDTTYVTYDTVSMGPPGREATLGVRGLACARAIATGAEAVAWFRSRGLRCAQLFQGFRPWVWKSGRPFGTDKSLLWIGHEYPGDGGRREKLDGLKAAGLPLVEGRGLYLELAAAAQRAHVVNLNFVPGYVPGSFSNRVIRTMASGGCVLSEACADLEAAFTDGEHLMLARGHDDMVDKARALLDCPDFCREVAESARELALERYRWDLRGELYLSYLRGRDVPDDGAAADFSPLEAP